MEKAIELSHPKIEIYKLTAKNFISGTVNHAKRRTRGRRSTSLFFHQFIIVKSSKDNGEFHQID
jgi:hypothetical protein